MTPFNNPKDLEMTNTDMLYDHALVAAANDAHAAAAAKMAAASASHACKQAAHQEAQRMSALAIAGAGDPLEAERHLHEAALRVAVAGKVRDHGAAVLAGLAVKVDEARGEAARPIAEAGFRALYLASVKHDAAVLMLAEAETDRASAFAVAMKAHAYGLTYVQPKLNAIHASAMQPAALRGEYMRGNRIDPETGKVV